ncbi:MAG: methionyl-tRNA formyltransferase [Candidatus Paceibacterota bacterium]|jgi:methionyl-tRNA formyltransferase
MLNSNGSWELGVGSWGKYNFVFFGTSNFAVIVLDELKAGGYLPSLIITVPDSPQGRKQIITPSPVKLWAIEHNIPIEQPEKLLTPNSQLLTPNRDFGIVVDYGKIIPQKIIDIPKHGLLNVHVSLLPKFRGASPMQTAILEGEAETGVTIMQVVKGLDEGDIIAQEKFDLANWHPYFLELADKTAHAGGKLLVKILPDYLAGKITPIKQDNSKATFTRKFEVQDGFIKPEIVLGTETGELAQKAERKVRALNPEPGTWTELKIRNTALRIKILKAHLEVDKFIPDTVIPAGKKEMSWQDFKNGNL